MIEMWMDIFIVLLRNLFDFLLLQIDNDQCSEFILCDEPKNVKYPVLPSTSGGKDDGNTDAVQVDSKPNAVGTEDIRPESAFDVIDEILIDGMKCEFVSDNLTQNRFELFSLFVVRFTG